MVRERRRPVQPAGAGNQQAEADEALRSLGFVGVGNKFRDRRFADYGDPGEELKSLLLDRWADIVRKGDGITVLGRSSAAGDLHMVLARACHLAEMPILVVGLSELARRLQHPEDELDSYHLRDVQGLFVRRFMADTRSPLRDYEQAMVEEFLDQHLDRGGSVFPWVIDIPAPPWFSEYTLVRLAERNGESFTVTT